MEPVTLSIPLTELQQVKIWMKEAMCPKVEFTGNMEEMTRQAELLRLGRIQQVLVWLESKI